MKFFLVYLLGLLCAAAQNARPPQNDDDLRYWLENMIVYHRFSSNEVAAATGLSLESIEQAVRRFGISGSKGRTFTNLLVLPYPGGRHPRIGFLEGAIDPQRETKISVFTPWDSASYVVVDVPEAIWSNLGLTYLAHTHVPTVWTKQNLKLPILEWKRHPDGRLISERTLPNQVAFGTEVTPGMDGVKMRMWLRNGSSETLRDLRVQNCIMLKAAAGFQEQTNANKVFSSPYAAARDLSGKRWIIAAFDPPHRMWGNPPVPCIHADPKFPDCAPGQTQQIRGWLSFYEGTNIQAEFKRLDSAGWK